MLHARPNLNGDTPETFDDTGYNIRLAAEKMRAALMSARECTHLRNYQTTDPDLRVFDVARLEGYILDALCELGRAHSHPQTQEWTDALQVLTDRTHMRVQHAPRPASGALTAPGEESGAGA